MFSRVWSGISRNLLGALARFERYLETLASEELPAAGHLYGQAQQKEQKALTHEDVHPTGHLGREAEEGEHSPAARLCAVSPAEHLLDVHSQRLGNAVPGEAASLLELVETAGEVVGQKP